MAQRTQDPTAPAAEPPSAAQSTSRPSERADVDDEQSPAEVFADVKTRLSELTEYAGYLLSAKVDGIKLAIRNAGIYAALGAVGLLAGGAFVVTAAVLLLRGIAG